MNRTQALTFLVSETVYPRLASRAGLAVSDTDDPNGWGPAITATFRTLGVARADVLAGSVATSLDGDAEALLRYHALDLLSTLVAADVDVRIDGVGSRSRSQAFKPLFDRLRADARQRVEALGYAVGGPTFTIGRLTLDYLEPEPDAAVAVA